MSDEHSNISSQNADLLAFIKTLPGAKNIRVFASPEDAEKALENEKNLSPFLRKNLIKMANKKPSKS